MSKESAVEIMVLNPDPDVHHHRKGVHENLWIKERFGNDNYLSIGVFLKNGTQELQFYIYEDCDKCPHADFFSSLNELQKHLPPEKKDIFDRARKIFLMGHGDAQSKYGFGNYHAHDNFNHPPDDTEQIYDDKFDELIQDILRTIHPQNDQIGITLEVCHADNLVTAENAGYTKSFLERLSAKYPCVTFNGTGPWSDSKDLQESLATDSRASGGFPTLNAPITAMGGGIWKNGNSVIFHHRFPSFFDIENRPGLKENYQVVVKKSMFTSTETAKDLKINTIKYACEILKRTLLDNNAKEIITKICVNRDILKIEDLKKVPDFLQVTVEDQVITNLMKAEDKIVKEEQNNYIMHVREILGCAEAGEKFREKSILIIALGLKDLSIFDGDDDLRDRILANKALLQLVMVACGKVLIAGPSNDGIIDLLLQNGIDINSVDEKGMTALHYAVQSFYNYRKEPLNLINKLLNCRANLEAEDKERRTPLMLATMHSRKGTVIAGGNLLELLEQRLADRAPVNAHTMRSLMSIKLGFFRKLGNEYLTEHRHDDPRLQHEYDKRFGLVLKK